MLPCVSPFSPCSIACTLQLVTFFFIAIFALHPHDYNKTLTGEDEYPHFFKMPVLMLILITVLNDGTLISVAYDHVKPSRHPEKWNLKVRPAAEQLLWGGLIQLQGLGSKAGVSMATGGRAASVSAQLCVGYSLRLADGNA
jgi:hypothetical protein